MAMLVKWENGKPVPVYIEPVTPQRVTTFMREAAGREYVPMVDGNGDMLPGEEQFIGMTKLQVGIERKADRVARGDNEALEEYLDRLAGKPKQQVETLQVTATLQDFLTYMKEEESKDPTIDTTDGVILDGGVYVKVEKPAAEMTDDEWDELGI